MQPQMINFKYIPPPISVSAAATPTSAHTDTCTGTQAHRHRHTHTKGVKCAYNVGHTNMSQAVTPRALLTFSAGPE